VLDAQRTLNDAQLTFIRSRQAYLSYHRPLELPGRGLVELD
jgi:hypothetical protein